MRALLFSLILFAVALPRLKAQVVPDLSKYQTTGQKLTALANVCDSLSQLEQWEKEKQVALYALRLAPTGSYYWKSVFSYYAGYSIEQTERSDSAVFYHEQGLRFAKLAKSAQRITRSLTRLLYMYTITGDQEKRKQEILQESLAAIDTLRDDELKVGLYSPISNYYAYQGQYEKQIRYLLGSIAIKKKLIGAGKIKDREAVVVDLMSLSELYIELGQGEKGIAYSKEGRKFIVAHEPYRNYHYKDMIDAYLLLRKPGPAKVYYDSLSAMIVPGNEAALRRINKIAADLVFADYYLSVNKPDSAYFFIRKTDELAPKWAGDQLQSQINFMKGNVLMARKDYASALPLLIASEPLGRDSGPQLYVSLLQSIARCYAATGQYEKAYTYYERYAPLRDSLYTESSKKSIADAEGRYQNQEKQQQIEVKNLQIDEARKQRLWLISGLSFLALSLVLLGIIFRNNKKNAKILDSKNHEMAKLIGELEEANRTKAKLFSIISHDLRSPISQIYQFLKLQQLSPKLLGEAQRAELSEKIQTATGSLLESMEDLLLWSKTQMNQFQPDIQPVDMAQVTDQCLKLLHLGMEAKQLRAEVLVPPQTMLDSDPYFLQAIVRNLLQNAIKAADPQSTIRLYWNEKNLVIENTGLAFSQEAYEEVLSRPESQQGLSGLGLRLVDELSGKAGVAVRFENPQPGITRAVITF